eukprot:Hpha_TRINITY_DN4284_c0_g1::TRINITY_DN4284_c0_g1_i1::g.186546::m.186546
MEPEPSTERNVMADRMMTGPTPSPPPSASLAPPLALSASPRGDVQGRRGSVPPLAPPVSKSGIAAAGRVRSAPPRPRLLEEVLSEKLVSEGVKYRRPYSGLGTGRGESVSTGLVDSMSIEAIASLSKNRRRRPMTANAASGSNARANLLMAASKAVDRKAGTFRKDNFREHVALTHLGMSLESLTPAALYTHARGHEDDDGASSLAPSTVGGPTQPPLQGRAAVVRMLRKYLRSARSVTKRRGQIEPLTQCAKETAKEPYIEYLGIRSKARLEKAEDVLCDVGLPHEGQEPPGSSEQPTDTEMLIFEDFSFFIDDIRAKAAAANAQEDLKKLEDEETQKAMFGRYMEHVIYQAEMGLASGGGCRRGGVRA